MERLPQTSHDRIRYAKDRLLEFRDACTEMPEELLNCSTFELWGRGARDMTIAGDPCNRSNPSQMQWQEEIVYAGLPPEFAKVFTPCRARRGTQSVYRTVKGILNKLTPENHDVLAEQIVQAGISSAEDLVGVTLLIYNEAVLKPALYAKLCLHLSMALWEFPDPDGGKPIKFRRVLLNTCQVVFDAVDRLREVFKKMKKPEQALELDTEEKWAKLLTLGNLKLICELFNQGSMIPEKIVYACILQLLGQGPKVTPSENVEALCLLFTTAGEKLEKRTAQKKTLNSCFTMLKVIQERTALPLRIRFMVRDVLDMRSNKWVPRREEVKRTTKPGPGALIVGPMGGAMKGPAGQARFGSSSMRAGGVGASVLAQSRGWYGFEDELRPLHLLWTGSTKPVAEPATAPEPADLRKKSVSLLREYFSVVDLMEALVCVQELNSPGFHPEFVRLAMATALDMRERECGLVLKLLVNLQSQGVISSSDLRAGVLRVTEGLEDMAMDAPLAPKQFGGMLAGLVLSGVVELQLVQEAALKLEDEFLQKDVLKAVVEKSKLKENEVQLGEVCQKASVDKERLLSVTVASDLAKLQAPAFSGQQAVTGAIPGFMVHDNFGMKSNKDDFNLRGLLQRVQMYGM